MHCSLCGVTQRLIFASAFLCVMLLTVVARGEAPATAPATQPDGNAVKQAWAQVVRTYTTMPQYHVLKTIQMKEFGAGEPSIDTFELNVSFNRENHRIRLTNPMLELYADNEVGQLRLHGVKGRYLDMPMAGKTLNINTIFKMIQGLGFELVLYPEIPLLLGDNPGEEILRGMTLVEGENGDRLLKAKRDQVEMSVRIGQDHLIKAWDIRFSMNGELLAHSSVELKPVEPPADALAFVAGDDKAVDSIPALLGKLEGGPAPDFELLNLQGDMVKLSEVGADVVILDFWATWCGPCRRGLPQLQAVHKWAEAEGKSVKIYAVNLREHAPKVEKFWQEQRLTMPVLLDKTGKVGDAYRVQGIPQTVIIHRGVVHEVHVGLVPNMVERMKATINELLEGPHPDA